MRNCFLLKNYNGENEVAMRQSSEGLIGLYLVRSGRPGRCELLLLVSQGF